MTWSRSTFRARAAPRARLASLKPLTAIVLLAATARIASAQAATPTTPTPATAPRYLPPSIGLVLPPPEGAVPADRPVVVFHFSAGLTPGQTSDPIDLASFRAWVDGIDRSASFKVDTEDAWGPLAPIASASSGPPSADSSGVPSSPSIAVGVHLVTARLCSMRGVCGELHALVTVSPGADPAHAAAAIQAAQAMQAPDSGATPHRSIGTKLLGALVTGVRKLFSH